LGRIKSKGFIKITLPLHTEVVQIAERIDNVAVDMGKTNCKTANAFKTIAKVKGKGKWGFKRKNACCQSE
jgi:hypothetical protein